MGEHLQLTPSELRFRFQLRQNIPVTLSLHNPGSETVAFKVKTTSPKKYCVRPSAGIVEPGSTRDVQVVMQAQREKPPSLADCKDKFLVQSCIVPSGVTEASTDLFENRSATEIKHTKLRVVLLGPPEPPSPVPEGTEEDGSPHAKEAFGNPTGTSNHTSTIPAIGGLGGSNDSAALAKENRRLADLLKQAERERSNIKGKLDLLEQSAPGHQASQQLKQAHGFTVLHLAGVALVSFAVAWYFF